MSHRISFGFPALCSGPGPISGLFLLFVLIVSSTRLSAADSPKPLRALLVTGGCCHNYSFQGAALTNAAGKLWPIAWTIVNEGGTGTRAEIPLNQYGKARVFGTTYGHSDETFRDPVFLEMVSRGLLWAAGREVN